MIPPEYVIAWVGKHNLDKDEEESEGHGVFDIIYHDDWNIEETDFDADIAILVLESDVDVRYQHVGIVCLPEARNSEMTGEGIVVGWGLSEKSIKDGTKYSSTPNELKLPVVTLQHCHDTNFNFEDVTSNRTFCAGYLNQGKSTCLGDSGSGFFVKTNRRYFLKGIVSTSLLSLNRCNTNTYSVFTDVTKFVGWIENKMEQTKEVEEKNVPFDCTPFYGEKFCKHNLKSTKKQNLNIEISQSLSNEESIWIDFVPFNHIFAGIGTVFKNLKRLSIQKQRIKYVESRDFKNLGKLNYLNLNSNRIRFLPEKVFSQLSNLEELYLRLNWIEKLPEKVFSKQWKLKILDLSVNNIQHFPEDVFSYIHNLKKLDLSFNKIATLPEYVFQNLRNLEYIDLKNNRISKFPQNLLINNTKLKRIINCFTEGNFTTDVDLSLIPDVEIFDQC